MEIDEYKMQLMFNHNEDRTPDIMGRDESYCLDILEKDEDDLEGIELIDFYMMQLVTKIPELTEGYLIGVVLTELTGINIDKPTSLAEYLCKTLTLDSLSIILYEIDATIKRASLIKNIDDLDGLISQVIDKITIK